MPRKSYIRGITVSGLMTAIICIISPISLPLPGMVPVSLATLTLYLCTYLLGTQRAIICYSVYMMLGCVGLPFFAGFTGGISRLIGPTGGYLIGYFLIIIAEGTAIKYFPQNKAAHISGMFLGTILCYLLGTVWLCFIQHIGFVSGITAGVLPFIPGDVLKIAAVSITAPTIRSRLEKAALLPSI